MKNFCPTSNKVHKHFTERFGEDTTRYIINEKFDLDFEYADNDYISTLTEIVDNSLQDIEFLKSSFIDSSYFKKVKKLIGYDNFRDLKEKVKNMDLSEFKLFSERLQHILSGVGVSTSFYIPGGAVVENKMDKIYNYLLTGETESGYYSDRDFARKYGIFGYSEDIFGSMPNLSTLLLNDYLLSNLPDDSLLEYFLQQLSEATGTEYIVLEDEEFNNLLLSSINNRLALNVNIEHVKQRLKDINAYVQNGDTKKIYFRKSKLNKKIATHETLHLVVDLIRSENPQLYYDLLERVKTSYEEEFTMFYESNKNLYLDEESLEEEALVYILQNITRLSIKEKRLLDIVKDIFRYIKKVILYLLGAYGDLNWKSYFEPKLELLSDDVFLADTLEEVNNILYNKGFNLPFNNKNKLSIFFNIGDFGKDYYLVILNYSYFSNKYLIINILLLIFFLIWELLFLLFHQFCTKFQKIFLLSYQKIPKILFEPVY